MKSWQGLILMSSNGLFEVFNGLFVIKIYRAGIFIQFIHYYEMQIRLFFVKYPMIINAE
jgi:hypothetical protein